jgi:hypothetical protein
MGCMDKKERGRGGKSRNEGRTRDRTGEWPRNTLNDGKRSESPVGPSLAKAAVGQEWQSQTKPTTEPGPFFPSPTPPRQFKSIFFSPSLSLLSFQVFRLISFLLQMTDSYLSSRTGDLSPNTNGGSLPNGSSPSLPSTMHGITPIIRKKLMGYVGFANLPNQVHRKSVRKGFQFTVMVVGTARSSFCWPFLSMLSYSQVNLAWESQPWSTPSSTPSSILPRSLPLRTLNDPRPSPSRASAPVIYPHLCP